MSDALPERVWLFPKGGWISELPSPGFGKATLGCYVQESALPTKAQIDRMLDAMPFDDMASPGWVRIGTMEDGVSVTKDKLRATLYRAAGIEVTDAST